MDILTAKIIAKISKICGRHPQIIAGYLFGSFSTGNQRPDSDIDLGFICYDKSDLDIPVFSVSLNKLLSSKVSDVTVLDLNEKPLILMEIINGKVLYQKSVNDRIKLENRILKYYEDYLHLQSIKNYYLNKSFTQGIYADK